MNILTFLLTKFGFGGKTLDKTLALLTKLDAELEAFDRAEAEKLAALEAQIAKASENKANSEAQIARAKRVRARVSDLSA